LAAALLSPGVDCTRNSTSASRTLYGIVVWAAPVLPFVSSALQIIGARTGIPPVVFGAPLPHRGDGSGIALLPSWRTLETAVGATEAPLLQVVVCDAACTAAATIPPPALTFATLAVPFAD